MLAEVITHPEYVTFKDLITIIVGSSGLLTLVFIIISKLFDRSSRSAIMEEISKIDGKFNQKIELVEKDISEVRYNYLDRFAEQKNLITTNKEIAESQHSEVMQALKEIQTSIKYLHK